MGLLTWGIVILLAIRIYKKQLIKPKVWKIVVALFAGLFSFSIDFNQNGSIIKVPILPLGVWILYMLLNKKEGRWQKYRTYAWLGFSTNFIILATSLLTIPFDNVIYPKNELSTYISNVENASIINIHPSAKKVSLDKSSLQEQLKLMKEKVYSAEWYEATEPVPDSTGPIKERYPYLLVGTTTKWGSDLNSIIYIEEDGKGLIITTSKKQLYFRSKTSFLKGGE
jgi:hypothetical protein